MDAKMKELVLLGASVSAHCFPCFDFHLEQARKLGIREEEILGSIRAGCAVMNGAGDKMREKIEGSFPEFSILSKESCADNQRTKRLFQMSMVRF